MLELKNVSKTFNPGTVNEKKALDKLSLNLNEGDFVTIIGANGAGKSTLFNAICGTFYTDEGQIILDGEDITLQPDYIRAKKIGHLFQDPMSGTAPGMTIEENMALAGSKGGWLSHVSKKEKELFREKLRPLNMGLEDRMHQPVGLLSGGQRQALTLVMATINPPKLLLLDEHTAALDPKTAAQVLSLTTDIVHKRNLTTLMITHNMKDALACGNRLIMLHDGKILIDVKGEEKKHLTIKDLLAMFEKAAGSELNSDALLLS